MELVQIEGAFVCVSDLIRRAKERIVLIDNYIDESILVLLDKRGVGVMATICTVKLSSSLQLDLKKHNEQYQPVELKIITGVHDRFLIIDQELYHIGASLKDLGKKLFAFSRLNTDLLDGLFKYDGSNVSSP